MAPKKPPKTPTHITCPDCKGVGRTPDGDLCWTCHAKGIIPNPLR
jgi:DnaJ-class molecular chaperone